MNRRISLRLVDSDSTEVDVVVLTWNDGALLTAALDSVRASVGVDAMMIVVDNGSEPAATVGTDVHLIRSETNLGVAAGRNVGIAAGASPYVMLLDSDAAVSPTAIRLLLDVLVADPTVAMAVPVFVDQSPEESAGEAPTLSQKLQRLQNKTNEYQPADRSPDARTWDVDFGIGACQLFSREAWVAVGGIDESYFYGPEDVDFCLRVGERVGRVVQVADAAVHHPPRRRFRGLATRRGAQHAWAVTRFLWRHRSRSTTDHTARHDRAA